MAGLSLISAPELMLLLVYLTREPWTQPGAAGLYFMRAMIDLLLFVVLGGVCPAILAALSFDRGVERASAREMSGQPSSGREHTARSNPAYCGEACLQLVSAHSSIVTGASGW